MAVSTLLMILAAALPAAGDFDAGKCLEKAFKLADAGNYSGADSQYRKILKEAPESKQAEVARRRLEPNALLRVRELRISGDPERRIDVFVMAEGYKRDKKYQRLFDQGAQETLKYFSQAPVFRRYASYFNFHAMNIASREDKVDRRGEDFDTALGAFESGASQGQVAVRHQEVMRYLAEDPRSEGYAVVIVRLGTLGTGGGGVAVVGGVPSNTVIHEWGHAFGRLLDEYTSDVGYTGKTPVGFNVSDSPDPEKAPWKHWIEAGTKGVGVFPGAAGRSKGAWRGTASGCAMNRGPSYCLVCREAVVAQIYGQVSPIDESTQTERVLLVEKGAPVTVQVVPMAVAGAPSLKVEFALEESQVVFQPDPEVPDRPSGNGGGGDDLGATGTAWDDFEDGGQGSGSSGRRSWRRPSRFGKQPDPPLTGTDMRMARARTEDRRTAFQVTLKSGDIAAGSYLLRARVKDPTDWVIKPEWTPLLTEMRTWKVLVR